jgi:hypothetical protein
LKQVTLVLCMLGLVLVALPNGSAAGLCESGSGETGVWLTDEYHCIYPTRHLNPDHVGAGLGCGLPGASEGIFVEYRGTGICVYENYDGESCVREYGGDDIVCR